MSDTTVDTSVQVEFEARLGDPEDDSQEESSGALARREAMRRRYSERLDLPGVSPTRFGDWEYAGRCTDF